MKDNAKIFIRGTQYVDDDRDFVELNTEGYFCEKNGCYYITYNEEELAGVKGAKTTIKIDGERRAVVIRGGANASTLIIEPDRRNLCQYATPYGDLMFGISSASIRSKLTPEGGSANIRYTLDVNNKTVSNNVLDIKVKLS